jgi:type II secretory pathway pseudopilin PulG
MIQNVNPKNSRGFTIIEAVIALAIIVLVLLAENSFLFWMLYYNAKAKANRETLENARRALDTITYEIRGSQSIYTPTTSQNQLSLETYRYVPSGENISFIDFFLCGTAICVKKEGQDPIPLTSDTIKVTSLQFQQLMNGLNLSIRVSLTADYKNPNSSTGNYSTINLSSSAALRSY